MTICDYFKKVIPFILLQKIQLAHADSLACPEQDPTKCEQQSPDKYIPATANNQDHKTRSRETFRSWIAERGEAVVEGIRVHQPILRLSGFQSRILTCSRSGKSYRISFVSSSKRAPWSSCRSVVKLPRSLCSKKVRNFMVNLYLIANLLIIGTDSSQGKGQIVSNINACLAVQATIRSTLGPYGGDLLLVDENGRQTITNDGATVMKVG